MEYRTRIFLKYIDNLSGTGFSFEKALISEFESFLKSNNNLNCTVVDFGCGQKPFSHFFKDFKGKYIGLDVYPGDKVDIVYDGLEIPLDKSSVDFVFSSSVFEHVEDIENTFGEISRVLKEQGKLVAVTPFINHVHGVPFDYHRPTRYGWESLIKKVFGNDVIYEVTPVDSRFNCIINLLTAQINLVILDMMRWAKNLLIRNVSNPKSLQAGDASPESHNQAGMRFAYTLLKLNPINFVLGLLAWAISQLPLSRRTEGEITSGYLIKVQKCVS